MILGLVNTGIIWTGLISDMLRGTAASRKVRPPSSRVETAYQSVLPVMWFSWLFSGMRGIVISDASGLSIFFMVLDILLSAFWWYKWKKDSDGRWKKRAKRLAAKVKVGEGKLVVVPVRSGT